MIKEVQTAAPYVLIENDQALAECCWQAMQQSVVALDTEFVRVSSYYPHLGLIQLYDGNQVSLIDPLCISDFGPFVELLTAPAVTKVLHACSEDLLVFLQEFDVLPEPMLDTQIMARFLGFSSSMGLSKLVQHFLGLEIDKGATRTNWLKRPLSPAQLQYAAGDVWYLLPIYQQMRQALQQTPWLEAVYDDCRLALMKTTKLDDKNPELAYLDIPNAWKLNPLELARLQLLAKWRLETAMQRDLAQSYVVKAESLWKVVKHNPHNTSEMLSLGLTESEVRVRGKKMLQLLAAARKIKPYDYPPRIARLVDEPNYKRAMRLLQEKAFELTPQGLTLEILASKRSLEDLLRWAWKTPRNQDKLPDLLIGWRRAIGLKLLDALDAMAK